MFPLFNIALKENKKTRRKRARACLKITSVIHAMSIIGNSRQYINSLLRLLIFIVLVLKPVINGA